MRLSSLLILPATFTTAALLSLGAASLSADLIEKTSSAAVRAELTESGMDWAEVYTEGLQVFLAGVAPTEADRFKAVSAASRIVDASRVIDNMQVPATAAIAPPRFSMEILRNDAGISLIGLIPKGADRAKIIRELKQASGAQDVADFLETADYAAPTGWSAAVRFALGALEDLPRAKISVEAGRVDVTAMADSSEERAELETDLMRRAPKTVEVNLAVSAPRPVITPFTLRFVLSEGVARFDACSADSKAAQRRILQAAKTAGLKDETGTADCVIGLGAPSTRWAEAVEVALAGLSELGGGTLTISDADVTLTAQQGTSRAAFDRVAADTEAALPDAFALLAILPPTPQAEDDTSLVQEFTATLSPEGLLQLRGRLPNEITRDATEGYAQARFGSETVYMATRLDETLPSYWPFRVMAGLDALALLHNGVLQITPEAVSVSGNTGSTEANARIAQILADRLSQTDHFAINVTYVEALDPLAGLPTAEECMANIQALQDETKIAFEPGKGTLDASADPILDQLAEQLDACPDLRIEIQGHTDSQGRESMNQALSQTRAQAVLTALQGRRVLTSGFLAVGYGESQPIADNRTEAGREANRRIEFHRILPEGAESANQKDTEAANGPQEASASPQDNEQSEKATDTDTGTDASDTSKPAAPAAATDVIPEAQAEAATEAPSNQNAATEDGEETQSNDAN